MINPIGITNYHSVSAIQSSQYVQKHTAPKMSDSHAESANSLSFPDRTHDFTHMTLEEQSNAAQDLYDQGVISMGEHAFMTGKYGLIEHDGQLGGTTLAQAKSEKINVIDTMKDNLAAVKSQAGGDSEVVKNYHSLIRKLEVYQFGLNASA